MKNFFPGVRIIKPSISLLFFFLHTKNSYSVSCLHCLGVSPCMAKEATLHPDHQARWEECVFPTFPPVTFNCPLFQQQWPALAFKTSVQPDYLWQGPRDLPACTSLFWTVDPNTLHLLEWHVAAILKGDPLLRLWCPPLCPKQASHSLCAVFHLAWDFSILQSDFWSEADKEQICMV